MRMLATLGLSVVVLAVSATAWAKEVQVHQRPAIAGKEKHAGGTSARRSFHGKACTARHVHGRRSVARMDRKQADVRALPPQDQVVGAVRVIGPREVGLAAWYGGGFVGMRTASGERLDTIHATAAHRTLPLHTLVRVTNLRNGRSAIATINDRGPVSRSLIIDLSPRMADELRMRHSGIAKVSVEPVTETQARH